MNDPRKVFAELSALYQFHKKLAKAFAVSPGKIPRVAEPPPRSANKATHPK